MLEEDKNGHLIGCMLENTRRILGVNCELDYEAFTTAPQILLVLTLRSGSLMDCEPWMDSILHAGIL